MRTHGPSVSAIGDLELIESALMEVFERGTSSAHFWGVNIAFKNTFSSHVDAETLNLGCSIDFRRL